MEVTKRTYDKESLKETWKMYYQNSKEKRKEYRKNNKDRIREVEKRYREKNKEKLKEYGKERTKMKNEFKNVVMNEFLDNYFKGNVSIEEEWKWLHKLNI